MKTLETLLRPGAKFGFCVQLLPSPPPPPLPIFFFTPCPNHPTALKGGTGYLGKLVASQWYKAILTMQKRVLHWQKCLNNSATNCSKWKGSNPNVPLPIKNSGSRTCCLPASFPCSFELLSSLKIVLLAPSFPLVSRRFSPPR